jgi:hypothetical protein
MARADTRFLSTASSNKIAVSMHEQVGVQLAVQSPRDQNKD